ncbi:MAG: DUF1854 domain-containing protein [Halanaerobiaceae bacterium]
MKKNEKQKETKGLSKYIDLDYINPQKADFQKTEGNILSLEYEEEKYERVHLYRSFPFTLENEYISVRDKEGEEIGIIKSIFDFDNKTVDLLEEELNWIYFCPDIEMIYSINEEFGYSYWDVETDQGRKNFTVKGSGQVLTPITEVRYIITDVNGNRFQISDVTELDSKSLNFIERYGV